MNVADNVFSKRFLLVSACVSILVLPISAYSLALHSGSVSVQDGPPIHVETTHLVLSSQVYSFTWGPGSQGIVPGTFCLEVNFSWVETTIKWENPNWTNTFRHLILTIKANDDDDTGAGGYFGVVFDTNKNGHIDLNDQSYGMGVNNKSFFSQLLRDGFLAIAWVPPTPGPHYVKFTPDSGYTLTVDFPSHGGRNWDPVKVLNRGLANPMHICFYDGDAGHVSASVPGVFVQFLFYVPEDF